MTCLCLLVMPLLLQPSTLLAFLAGAAHSSLTLSLLLAEPQLVIPQPVLHSWIMLSQVQDFTLILAGLQNDFVIPLSQLTQALLQGGSPFQRAHLSTPSGITSKLCQGTLDPPIQITYEDLKQHWAYN